MAKKHGHGAGSHFAGRFRKPSRTNALQPVTLPAMVIRIASSRCGLGMSAHILIAFVA
jgi:hypothetical protein